MGRAAASGPQSIRSGAHKVYRGARARVRRIRLRDNTPASVVVLGIVLLVVIIAVIVWMVQHPDLHHH